MELISVFHHSNSSVALDHYPFEANRNPPPLLSQSHIYRNSPKAYWTSNHTEYYSDRSIIRHSIIRDIIHYPLPIIPTPYSLRIPSVLGRATRYE